ncbi:MAG: LysR family transcriptional regulator [Alphaproteobacteria bacterium]|nr:LysR family transcriptional regulator [Alphaproteobacteria bacterium]
MNLRYLLQFYELSHHETMSSYAKAVGVTAPQVTRMVSELEKEFNAPLLIRKKNRAIIEFTEKGKLLLSRIPIILSEIKNTKDLVQLNPNEDSGKFNLYTTHFLIDYLLSPHLIRLKEKVPGITLDLYGLETPLSEKDKKYNLSISPYVPNLAGITQVDLMTFHIGLWASEDYIRRCGEPKHPSDLKGHNFLCFEEKWPELSYPTVNWYLENSFFEVREANVQVIRSSVGIMQAAKSGLGIFSVSKESLNLFDMKFVPILPNLKGPVVRMCFTYPNEWKDYKSIKSIEEFLVSLFKTRMINE